MKRIKIEQLIGLLCFLMSYSVFSQRSLIPLPPNGTVSISGPTSVNEGETQIYYANTTSTIFSGTWSVANATIISQSSTSASIKWTTAGARSITYVANTSDGTLEDYLGVTVNGTIAPTNPSNPTISSQDCSSAILLRGTPPSGVTWYWQGTNRYGTSTSNSNTTYTTSTSGRHYLRARNSSGVWSTGSGYVDVTIAGCSSGGGITNDNYVYTIVPQKEATSTSSLTATADAIRSITYFDGLGRAKQSIGIKQSNNEQDVVTHIAYDNLGRQVKEYLPYAAGSAGGSLKGDALTATNNYYKTKYATDVNASNPNPYSEKLFEESPLNRVLKQAAPGEDWKLGNGHEIKFAYDANTGTEVRNYYVTISGNAYTPTLQLNTAASNNYGYYNEGELTKTITKDENWETADGVNHTTEEFKNKQGQVVLKRTYNAGQKHDTYYVYDDFGNLTYVLPPKSEPHTAKPDSVELAELCYQYVYDTRNRLAEKKIPGKEWEYIVYDKLDRPILTQDANLRGARKWLFTKYDLLGRVVYTGIYTHPDATNQLGMQGYVNAINNTPAEYYEEKLTSSGSLGIYYSNSDFPTSNLEVLTVNYYDNYTFNKEGAGTSISSYGVNSTTRLKGLATGSRVKVLGTSNWITTVTYYDEKARPIYVYSNNVDLKTIDIVKSKLDFTGKLEETTSTHNKTDDSLPVLTVIDKFTYDHVGRLLKHTQQGTNISGIEVIAENTYDGLGQLERKEVGGKTTQNRLQKIDYKYNIRGWLKNINQDVYNDNDLFNFTLKYNDASDASKKLYNGNISETLWNTLSVNTLNAVSNKYVYTYDALNRITRADDNTGRYDVYGITYDKNGNITTLRRDGHLNSGATSFGVMDHLDYNYNSRSNKLVNVQEVSGGNPTYGFKDGANTSVEYTYDANGNMITDANKNITSITYNHLNLPTKVIIGGGTIYYTYDATGVKLKKLVSGITTEYAGNYIYEKSGKGAGVLQFFNQPEGYVKNDSGTFKYIYQYKDHLGNVRLSYTDNNNDGVIQTRTTTEIIEESNYYPFGLKHKGYNVNYNPIGNAKAQKFGYNGKELNEELELEWHDFGARNYDAALGRWMNLDPLAEEMRRHSPYNYAFNNPVYFIDPDGMAPQAPEWKYLGNGKWMAEKGDGAESLAKAANISKKRAYIIMANTTNESSSLGNMGTYEDLVDGVVKSAVDPGDIVVIPEQERALKMEDKAIDDAERGRNKDALAIVDLKKENDSLQKVKKKAVENHSFNKSAKAFKSYPGDPGAAGAWSELGTATWIIRIEINVNSTVKKNNKTIDSLRNEIDKKGKEIQRHKKHIKEINNSYSKGN